MWFYALVPVLLTAAAIWIAARSWRIARWPRAASTVRRIDRVEEADGWAVTFVFDDPGTWPGEAVITVDSPTAFALGQAVALRRNPRDPAEVETLHPRRVAIVVAMLLAMAAPWVAGFVLG